MDGQQVTPEQFALVNEWQQADKIAKEAVARERELRSQVSRELFKLEQAASSPDEYAGTKHVTLANGWRIKFVGNLDYKLNNKDNQVDHALERFPEELAALLVSWTPNLSVHNYKLLTEDQQKLFRDSLTVKNASPKLELVAPK
jgi:hypothetical protein